MNTNELLNLTGVAIVIHEVRYGTVVPVWASDNIEQVLGHEKDFWLGKGEEAPVDILHPDDQNIMYDFYPSLEKDGYYQSFQRHYVKKLKRYVWVFVSFSVMERDAKGQISKIIAASFRVEDNLQSSIQTEYFLNDHLESRKKIIFEMLSDREVEIARLLADGLTDKEVGEKLGISEATVKKHRFNILKKFDAKNFMKIARYFY